MAKEIKIDHFQIKLLGHSDSTRTIKLQDGFSFEFFDDKVILNNDAYKSIFGIPLECNLITRHGRGYIEIKVCKKSYFRIFYGGSTLKIKNGEGCFNALNYHLIFNGKSNCSVTFIGHPNYSPRAFIGFYWNHPQNSMRIPFKLAVLSFILGVISVIISIVPVL